MGSLTFDSYEDVRLRLNRTVCMYRGHPYYVTNEAIAPPSKDVYLFPLDYRYIDEDRQNIRTRISHEDPDFDCRSPELGYCNWQRHAIYLSRIPDRRQRQGLSLDVLRFEPNDNRLGLAAIFTSKELEECILGKHVTLNEAIKLIESGVSVSVPIHRHFAVSQLQNNHVMGLYYRGRLIGTKNDYNDRFAILPSRDYSFLNKIAGNLGLI